MKSSINGEKAKERRERIKDILENPSNFYITLYGLSLVLNVNYNTLRRDINDMGYKYDRHLKRFFKKERY